MSRKIARENAYKLVFEFIFNEEQDEETKGMVMIEPDLTDADKAYIETITAGVETHYQELLDIIQENAKNFRLDRIFKPDLAALLLAVYEMKYMDDIPMSVSISEVVDIVKIYSTEKSNIFVNGVLAGVYKSLNKKE